VDYALAMWNPFRSLNELPDSARLGVYLMFGGVILGTFRYAWQFSSSSSYKSVSAAFMRLEPYLPGRHSYMQKDSLDDFGQFLLVIAFLLCFCGAFIFLRRGFWWVAEHRKERGITEIDLK
jgi:hypothetical protein